MEINNFLICLSYLNDATGISNTINGVYDFSSGNSELIYNQLYPTGYHYQSGAIFADAIPIISLSNNILISGNCDGTNCFSVGYGNINNFSILIDLNYTGCTKIPLKDYIILGTSRTPNDTSGFFISINDNNRLSFNSTGFNSTLNKELKERNFIYCSVIDNQYIEYGVFDLSSSSLVSQNIVLDTPLEFSSLYLGGLFDYNYHPIFLNEEDTNYYTGFIGKINNAYLFNNGIISNDIYKCVDCSYVTGIDTVTGNLMIDVLSVTGLYYSGVTGTYTSSSQVYGSLLTENGSSKSIIYTSDNSGQVITGEVAIPLYNSTGIYINQTGYSFLYDTDDYLTSNKFLIEFDPILNSGDILEIYTYSKPNTNIGIAKNDFSWPDTTGYIQLIGNGLEEVNEIDYNVVRNYISGYDGSDILIYDIGNRDSIAVYFSGEFSGYVASGLLDNVIPDFDSNYGEEYLPKILNITGLSGICINNSEYPNFGYDIYLNGQKLISGIQYNISEFNSNFTVSISGSEIMDAYVDLYYNETGWYLERIINIDNSEILFVPQYSGFNSSIYEITGDIKYVTGLNGFSEQLWINGIRVIENIDYYKYNFCSVESGLNDLSNLNSLFFNNNQERFNFEYPPVVTDINPVNISPSISGYPLYDLSWTWEQINLGTYESGNFLEVHLSTSGYGSINYDNMLLIDVLDTSETGFSITASGTQFDFSLRYKNNNIIGDFSDIISIGT